jgi:hypothetical protein
MNEDVFNSSIRKFLKTLGVSAQREIEKAVRHWQAQGQRDVSGPGDGDARRHRLLPRNQRRDRAGIAGSSRAGPTPLALIGAAHFSISLLTNPPAEWSRQYAMLGLSV